MCVKGENPFLHNLNISDGRASEYESKLFEVFTLNI